MALTKIENIDLMYDDRDYWKNRTEKSIPFAGQETTSGVTPIFKNPNPYYIPTGFDAFKYVIPARNNDYSHYEIHEDDVNGIFFTKYLISPTEQYLTRFKNGITVEIIPLWSAVRKDTRDVLRGRYFLYGNGVYRTDRYYNDDELRLLVLELEDKERQKFERLRQKFLDSHGEVQRRRERIPENVRVAVWRRDEGQCNRCGSRENLEYDHIIPVSKGGSNTARNIELLCERCNREKHAKIE